jgi:AcrR family transcriptional regulator
MAKKTESSKAHYPQNHRTRVGKQRREQTEARILRAAVNVFATKSLHEVGVNDLIREAQVSRGTFYNHFRTNEDLLVAVINWLHSDLTQVIEAAVRGFDNPLHRLSLAIRIFYRKAMSDAVWAELISARMPETVAADARLWRDMEEARKLGLLQIADMELGLELLVGTVMRHVGAHSKEGLKPRRKREMVRMILRGLGADEASIQEALQLPLPPLGRKPHTFKAARAKKKR